MDEIYSALLENIKEIDARDESQILAELAGETIKEYIYQTEVWDWVTDDNGKRRKKKVKKTKLSWVGTREAARGRGNIMISDPMVTEAEDHIRVMVKATDISQNFAVFGGCHVPKKMKVNDYDDVTGEVTGSHYEDDPFAFQKGLSKAQRNALAACIPDTWTSKFIQKCLANPQLHALRNGHPREYITDGQKRKTEQKIQSSQLKPRAEWDKVTADMVSEFSKLAKVLWDLAKIQPGNICRELGVSNQRDLLAGITDPEQIKKKLWDSFLTLRNQYVPKDKPIDGEEPPIEEEG